VGEKRERLESRGREQGKIRIMWERKEKDKNHVGENREK
jgi:hypothetical protein